MDEQRRHDSMAPKGAFGADATDEDTDAEISIVPLEPASLSAEDLCADELIPVGGEPLAPGRVSMEDAMRALIELRLERTRPSEDFGAFELSDAPIEAVATRSSEPVGNSLAPIELSRVTPITKTSQDSRKWSPMPLFAAAAVALLSVGVYRRTHIEPTAEHARVQAVAPAPATVVAAPTQLDVIGTSESEYATLTLGTPTILYIAEEVDEAKPHNRRHERSAKHTAAKEEPAARVAAIEPVASVAETPQPAAPTAKPQPATPSREAIVAGFNSVRDAVVTCANGGGGVAPIEATIVGDGHIIHATVRGYYQGTPEGSCIARALRTAQFEPFSGESIKVAFPYTL